MLAGARAKAGRGADYFFESRQRQIGQIFSAQEIIQKGEVGGRVSHKGPPWVEYTVFSRFALG
jgi:hypothetical protein